MEINVLYIDTVEDNVIFTISPNTGTTAPGVMKYTI